MKQTCRNCSKTIMRTRVLLFSILLLSLLSANCFAGTYEELKIYPKNVGVFTTIGEQQFTAFGLNSETQEWDNITTKVSWESGNDGTVTIDDNGLATIHKTYGLVSITCTYPKRGASNSGANFLLLKKDKSDETPKN